MKSILGIHIDPSSRSFVEIYDPIDIFHYLGELNDIFENVSCEDIVISSINFKYLLSVSGWQVVDRITQLQGILVSWSEDPPNNFFFDQWLFGGYRYLAIPKQEKYKIKNDNLSEENNNGVVWFNTDSKVAGKCIISFVQHYCKFKKPVQAIRKISEIIGVDFNVKGARQLSVLPGMEYVPRFHLHSKNTPLFFEKEEIRLHNYVDNYKVFRFDDENSNCGVSVVSFGPLFGRSILYLTIQRNLYSGDVAQKYIEPPEDYLLLNQKKIFSKKCERIFIFDDIQLVEKLSSEYHVTWSGSIDICKRINWGKIKDKSLCYCFDPNNGDSIFIGNFLLNYFSEVDRPLRLSCYSSSAFNEMGFPQLSDQSEDQFYQMVKSTHMVPIGIFAESMVMSTRELNRCVQENEYVLDDLVRVGDRVFVYGKGRIGKSLFALDVAISAASGECLRKRDNARSNHKVLYLDANVQRKMFISRYKKMALLLKGNLRHDLSINYLNLYDNKEDIDLGVAAHRLLILKEIKNNKPDVLVFDDPLALVRIKDNKNYRNVVELLNLFLGEIVRAMPRLTLMIFCDESKFRLDSLSREIDGFYNTFLRLSRPKNCPFDRTVLEVSVVEASYLSGRQRSPFFVTYHDEESFTRRLTRPDDSELSALSEIQRKIVESARKTDFVTVKYLREKNVISDLSDSAATDNLRKLCGNGWLYKTGLKNQTKYYAT